MTTLVGLDLGGRDVVMIGGGAVTARRLPRLIADGARLTVIAPDLSARTRELIDAHAITWRARGVRRSDIATAWLVHTATGDPRVDLRVAAWCERRRTLCVNASDGSHGSARLTAQTRSGDVVVGVASDTGVDPRRAAGVRDAISTLLDEGRLPIRRRRRTTVGHVALVGGGPGPLDLLTVRARRLVAEADVIIADRLGPAADLRASDTDVEIIDVGKRPGHHPVPQDEINALLVAHARQGRRVVRLKGGDPFVYGRGGEEVRACHAAGVPVEVVPGISSIVAVPEAAGIPVTHRGTAAAVHVVNGQDATNEATLSSLRDPATTVVVLMGVSAIPRLQRDALAAGIDPDLPAAIVEDGHGPHQRTTRTRLGTLAADAAAGEVRNPAVIVLGDVARADLLLPAPALAGDTTR